MTTAISPDAYSQMTTEQLLEKYKETGCEEYKWEVALRSSNLIKHIALRNRDAYASFAQLDDIVHEGILALLDAIEKYDPAKGGLFSVYVSKRIRGMIFDLAREHDWVPRTIRKRSQTIDRATSELLAQLGRFPTDHELAAHLGITDKEYREAADHSYIVSLDAHLENFYETPDMTENSSGFSFAPEEIAENNEMLSVLSQAISSLKQNEQLVLSLHYEKDLKIKEIAAVMGISISRVSQVHVKAIRKLRAVISQYMNDASKGEKKHGEGILQSDVRHADTRQKTGCHLQ